MMKDLGLIKKLPRIVVAQAQRRTRFTLVSAEFESFKPIRAEKTLASAIQLATR